MITAERCERAEKFLDELQSGDEVLIKSRKRVKDAGEVFTPRWCVKDMLDLDKIKELSFELDSTFLEPSCGNGNFIIQILVRKLMCVSEDNFDTDVARSVASIYGVDITEDNIKETRDRMMLAIKALYSNFGRELTKEIECSLWYIMYRNIILGNTLTSQKIKEMFTSEELVSHKAYLNERVAKQALTANRAKIVDTRYDAGMADLVVSEWKFSDSGVARDDFRMSDIASGTDSEPIASYDAVPLDKLSTVEDKVLAAGSLI